MLLKLVSRVVVRGGVIDAWEPADEYKGDFARSYMYMVTSYEDLATKWTGNSVNQLDNNTYPVFEQWTIDLFLKWCAQDPVSQKEIDRNNAIYKIQGNRNPYIDYPLLAEYVWGKLMSVPFTYDGNVSIPYLSSPASGSSIDFGKVVFQQTDTASILIKASNLSDDLSVSITGTDAANFSVNSFTISKTEAEAGFKLIVNYNAQSVGLQTAQLTLSGGGITSISVNLKATSSNDFQALTASSITNSGFNANWTVSAGATGYTLNVFSLISEGATQSKTLISEEFLNGLPSNWTATGYTDNLTSGNMRLASGSSAGKISTPALDLSTSGTVLTVRARQYNADAGAQLTATINNLPLTVWTTAVTNQDFTFNIPQTAGTSVISLSAASNSRVYVDYVKVETQGSVKSAVSAAGYPMFVGNTLTYSVTNLNPDSTYYYTIQPEGNSSALSNQIQVHTALLSDVTENQSNPIKWSVSGNVLVLNNIPINAKLTICDMLGKQIQSLTVYTSSTSIQLPKQGLYLLHIQQKQSDDIYKIFI